MIIPIFQFLIKIKQYIEYNNIEYNDSPIGILSLMKLRKKRILKAKIKEKREKQRNLNILL